MLPCVILQVKLFVIRMRYHHHTTSLLSPWRTHNHYRLRKPGRLRVHKLETLRKSPDNEEYVNSIFPMITAYSYLRSRRICTDIRVFAESNWDILATILPPSPRLRDAEVFYYTSASAQLFLPFLVSPRPMSSFSSPVSLKPGISLIAVVTGRYWCWKFITSFSTPLKASSNAS